VSAVSAQLDAKVLPKVDAEVFTEHRCRGFYQKWVLMFESKADTEIVNKEVSAVCPNQTPRFFPKVDAKVH
jgi:hypothetical protein